ncbi:MAG: hypothetical protein EAX91_12570 [Candidatus Lokiarchaeota archaeon]|nr:hypothetical protein [Candidatus Lokiarchaeota archaeon]
MKSLIERSKQLDKTNIYVSIFRLHKSYLVLISDQESMGIGNVTLGIPPTIENVKVSAATHQLFGVQQRILSNIIVEKLSSFFNAPVLLLLFLKSISNDQEIIKPLISFLKEILNEISQNGKTNDTGSGI